jgi:hypothetical protein
MGLLIISLKYEVKMKVPLLNYIRRNYPETSPSTARYWAKLAVEEGRGPLAGIIERIVGRWYVIENLSQFSDVVEIAKDIDKRVKYG